MTYTMTHKQARETLTKLNFATAKLPAIGRSLILNFPGVAWRIDAKAKDIFLLYQLET